MGRITVSHCNQSNLAPNHVPTKCFVDATKSIFFNDLHRKYQANFSHTLIFSCLSLVQVIESTGQTSDSESDAPCNVPALYSP